LSQFEKAYAVFAGLRSIVLLTERQKATRLNPPVAVKR
jgi:hypothetical protein